MKPGCLPYVMASPHRYLPRASWEVDLVFVSSTLASSLLSPPLCKSFCGGYHLAPGLANRTTGMCNRIGDGEETLCLGTCMGVLGPEACGVVEISYPHTQRVVYITLHASFLGK